MHVRDTLEKRMEETEHLIVDKISTDLAHQVILENQLQIMRGLHALLCGEFVPYDDSKKELK